MPPMECFVFCRLLAFGPNSLVLRPAISEAPTVSKKVTEHLAGWRFGDLGPGIYTFSRSRGGLHDSVYAEKILVCSPQHARKKGLCFFHGICLYKKALGCDPMHHRPFGWPITDT